MGCNGHTVSEDWSYSFLGTTPLSKVNPATTIGERPGDYTDSHQEIVARHWGFAREWIILILPFESIFQLFKSLSNLTILFEPYITLMRNVGWALLCHLAGEMESDLHTISWLVSGEFLLSLSTTVLLQVKWSTCLTFFLAMFKSCDKWKTRGWDLVGKILSKMGMKF